MLFLIPARAGSRRLPGKNKLAFCGMPLYRWSLACARRLQGNGGNLVVISTDDPDILAAEPCAYARPSSLCGDECATADLIDYMWSWANMHDSIVLLQPTSPTRSDSLVRQLIAHGGQVRSVTNGVPNGQCYVYRRGATRWVDIETEKGHDIDTLADFEAAEKEMLKRFA